MRTHFLFLSLLLSSSLAYAGRPVLITQQGRLLDAADQPVDVLSMSMKFSLWNDDKADSAGAKVWPATGESECTAKVVKGQYAVVFDGAQESGCGAGLTTDQIPAGAARWLQINVAGTVLTPRLRLGVTPVALEAEHAKAADTSLDADHAKAADEAAKLGGHDAAFFSNASNLSGKLTSAVSYEGAAIGDAFIASASSWNEKLAAVTDATVPANSLTGDRIKAGTIGFDRLEGPVPDAAIQSAASWNAKLAAVTDTTVPASSLTGDRLKAASLPLDRLAAQLGDAQISGLSRSKLSGLDVVPVGAQPSTATAGQMYFDSSSKQLRFYDGVRWTTLYKSGACGATAADMATSCKAIRDSCPGATSGVYYVRAVSGAAVRTLCDMKTQGGGWELCSNFIDTTGDDLRSDIGAFNFTSDWGGYVAAVPGEITALNVAGTLNCAALAAGTAAASEARFECTNSTDSALKQASWQSNALPLGDTPSLAAGTWIGGQLIQSHGEYGWGGYNHGSFVLDDAPYPNCGGNSCGFDATRNASGINMELAGGYDSPGCASGCNANPKNWTGAQEGASCGGVDTSGVAGERYSIWIR